MNMQPTDIAGLYIAETEAVHDHRGSFMRYFCLEDLEQALDGKAVVQVNYSSTTMAGAVRGLHYQQSPHAEMKLVRCLRGRVWDVAVDLRRNSPTFLQWHAEELTPENARMMIIPEGCAHGFQALAANSELLYLHTAAYAPQSEGGILHDDPALAITWPLAVADLSSRDRSHPPITPDFKGITI